MDLERFKQITAGVQAPAAAPVVATPAPSPEPTPAPTPKDPEPIKTLDPLSIAVLSKQRAASNIASGPDAPLPSRPVRASEEALDPDPDPEPKDNRRSVLIAAGGVLMVGALTFVFMRGGARPAGVPVSVPVQPPAPTHIPRPAPSIPAGYTVF